MTAPDWDYEQMARASLDPTRQHLPNIIPDVLARFLLEEHADCGPDCHAFQLGRGIAKMQQDIQALAP